MRNKRTGLDQSRAPIYEALENFRRMRVVPFDVPGHKRGRVCSEFVMCYPPGIPILAPGERITGEILEHIGYAKEKGCSMTGSEDPDLTRINVLE